MRRILFGFISFLLVLSLLLGAFGVYTVRRSFPQTKGEIRLAGLKSPVEVLRDEWGVPHIYAASSHDLFFAQGYLHAQDRFWQMDFWRHLGAGRLSEMFGDGQVDTDKFLRTLGWSRLAEQEAAQMDDHTRIVMQAYADGVNAYLANRSGSALSLEHAVLRLLAPNYHPEPWKPEHTLTWGKAMAWDLRGNMDEEIERAVLLASFTPEQVAEISPLYPSANPLILPDFHLSAGAQTMANRAPSSSTGQVYTLLAPAFQSVRQDLTRLEGVLGPSGREVGSNNWVIRGERTASGKPLLANDPHLGEQIPSIWYEVALHCTTVNADCPYDVTGFSFAGVPGVIVGHNARIAWGVTNVGPDVQDLFIEKVNPQNPNQVEFEGQLEDVQSYDETIQVAGGEPISFQVRQTRHGPIISDTFFSPEELKQLGALELPDQFAISLRWTALEPTRLFNAVLGFDRAANWDEFRQAARDFVVPAQNLVFADVDGNIGYQMPGNIPVRASGDGRLPVPGWTGEYEWTGYIPFEELPYVYNPPQGYIVTANNAVVGTDYPFIISTDWDLGYRASRITQMIEQAGGPIDIPTVQAIQGDNKNLAAEALVPVLMQVSLDDERLKRARSLLQDWDYQDGMDSAPAALFNAFWKNLLAVVFQDEMPEGYAPQGSSRWFAVMSALVDQPNSPWWNDTRTPENEARDDMLRKALGLAVDELEKTLGKDPANWKWGDLHTLTLHNGSLGNSGVAPIEALFNRGPFRISGGSSIVNATGWDASDSYQVRALPSMRMVVDLSDLSRSQTIHTTGQSGHPYHPHYVDMTNLWRMNQFHNMLWTREQVESASKDILRLIP